ncbi:MAG TPA: glutaredoxin [Cytophagales bacterium]|nr:glutaredoxin [Cytophagales bacterium]
MKFHPNELFFIYDASSTYSRQTLAYAYTFTKHVQAHEVQKDPFTTTLWREILNRLNCSAKDLLNRAHKDYQGVIAGGSYDEEAWLHILTHNAHLIRYPIAIFGKKAVLCKSPTDIQKLRPAKPKVETQWA